ncbi:MAG TPA: hydantoinase/oxoprolinase family protein [Geminicoccaceae bacterium]|nr:hydantoinase/oxoprolinase family protein [Geminicoccaceae bacterium]
MASPGRINRIAVDIGGTFTDVVAEAGGRQTTAKVLTTPRAPERGVLEGIRLALGQANLAPGDVGLVIHGTTLATNAVLERKGAATALVTTRGFRDVLEIGDEGRFDQYDIWLEKPEPLVPRHLRLSVPERLDIEGNVLLPLDEAAVRALAPELERHGVESVAVGFLHSYVNPVHERRAAEILRGAMPELWVTLSSEVCPEIREYERFTTASANAYVQPLMARYLTELDRSLEREGFRCPLFLMTSGGGLTAVETAIREPIRLVESGPAGGAILAGRIAEASGLERVLSFDMGGTTAKICLIDEFRPQTARTFEIDRAARFLKGSGLPLRIPVIEMVEIGAGGGSIAGLDATGKIRVGPESAGADPGPACYGRGGGGATVTDADVLLGRIDPDSFAGGRMKLDRAAAEAALRRAVGEPLGLDADLAAFGVCEMVDEAMANAARVHAVERGKDVAERTLVAFGGAAPLHASRLAEKLGIRRVVVPTDAGVGSAVGFLRAPVAYEVVRSRYMRLGEFDAGLVNEVLATMEAESRAVVEAGAPGRELRRERAAYMRYVGQGHEIVVELPDRDFGAGDGGLLQRLFDDAYRALYGRVIPNLDVEVLTWTLTVSTPGEAIEPATAAVEPHRPEPSGRRRVFDAVSDSFVEVPTYRRADLRAGATVDGPAVIFEDDTTIFVSSSFGAAVDARRYVVLERKEPSAS